MFYTGNTAMGLYDRFTAIQARALNLCVNERRKIDIIFSFITASEIAWHLLN